MGRVTRISGIYRAASNSKLPFSWSFAGEITPADRVIFEGSLNEGEYLAPEAVGLSHPLDNSGWEPSTDEDHAWVEIEDVEVVDGEPTDPRPIGVFVDELAVADQHAYEQAFQACLEEGDGGDVGGSWWDDIFSAGSAAATAMTAASGPGVAVCGASMPVARARCVLSVGHVGGHRSVR